MKRIYLLFSTAIFLAALFAISWAAEDKPYVVPVAADGIQKVEMIGGSYFFKPKHIIVKVNIPVELSLKKESGVTPHNIVLKAPEAGININEELSSTPKIVRFTPTKKGKYPFECDKKLLFFESHKDKGMEGTLEVVD
jgi:plastocyanin domain-containing protein